MIPNGPATTAEQQWEGEVCSFSFFILHRITYCKKKRKKKKNIHKSAIPPLVTKFRDIHNAGLGPEITFLRAA